MRCSNSAIQGAYDFNKRTFRRDTPLRVPAVSLECLYDALNKTQTAVQVGCMWREEDAMANTVVDAGPDTRRRRSESRQRTQQVKLRLLPQEEELLRQHAQESGFPTVQAYILHRLPEIAAS